MGEVTANYELALKALKETEATIEEFKSKLNENQPAADAVSHVLDKTDYLIEKIASFLSGKVGEGFTERDARVFSYVLLTEYDGLVEFADELDLESQA